MYVPKEDGCMKVFLVILLVALMIVSIGIFRLANKSKTSHLKIDNYGSTI